MKVSVWCLFRDACFVFNATTCVHGNQQEWWCQGPLPTQVGQDPSGIEGSNCTFSRHWSQCLNLQRCVRRLSWKPQKISIFKCSFQVLHYIKIWEAEFPGSCPLTSLGLGCWCSPWWCQSLYQWCNQRSGRHWRDAWQALLSHGSQPALELAGGWAAPCPSFISSFFSGLRHPLSANQEIDVWGVRGGGRKYLKSHPPCLI